MVGLFTLILAVAAIFLVYVAKKHATYELPLALYLALANVFVCMTFLLVIAPLIPNELKAGHYGGAGGLIGGIGIGSTALTLILFVRLIKKIKE